MAGTFVRECLAFDAKNLGNIGNAIGARYRVEVDCFFIVAHECAYITHGPRCQVTSQQEVTSK